MYKIFFIILVKILSKVISKSLSCSKNRQFK